MRERVTNERVDFDLGILESCRSFVSTGSHSNLDTDLVNVMAERIVRVPCAKHRPLYQTRVLVLGASGGLGRHIVQQALSRGMVVTAQTRNLSKLKDMAEGVQVGSLDPTDAVALESVLRGHNAVIFALGVKRLRTTLFSDSTRALLPAMKAADVRRLVAIRGVGAGDTKGYGGFLYDRVIYSLQEHLIESSDLDWVIVRPAVFSSKQTEGQLQAITRIEPDTVLRRTTRSEVATFVLNQLQGNTTYLHTKVFIGHP